MVHEIINPMENFWQDIFKHAYLALKEVLDANISFLHERELISKFNKEANHIVHLIMMNEIFI